MKVEHGKYYTDFLRVAANIISKAVRGGLSDAMLRDFMLWLLQDGNPQQENYLRMLGVAGSVELELQLFKQVLAPAVLHDMAHYIGILNAYFAYETLSDNLGVGLAASAQSSNPTYMLQKEILLHFNRVMLAKINGEKAATHQLLAPIADLVKQISVNKKTLAPQQMQIFIEAYAEQNSDISKFDLEHSFMAILILNIETCLQLLDSLSASPIYPILKESLLARYSAVNKLIKQARQANLEQLASWGLDSILVVPTLAYCVGALNEVKPYVMFKTVINNGLLSSAMADAALLTRLLNDVGTRLLQMKNTERKDLYKKFQSHLTSGKFASIFSYLDFLAKQEELLLPLTRIRKDLQHGEFNVCLDQLIGKSTLTDALTLFCENIDHYAELYRRKYAQLLTTLDQLNTILGDDQVGKIILHFVQFHEYKYSFEFESMQGDYAITGST